MKISKRAKKIFGVVIVSGLIFGSWATWYVFFKPHRNVGNEKPAYTITTTDLSKAFKTDTTSLTKYIDKAIAVEGIITAIEGSHVSFDNVTCNIDSTDIPKLAAYKVGGNAKLQGRLTTYNDLMDEILMDQCVFK